MNVLDSVSLCLWVILLPASWIHAGLPNELPPARCHMFIINAWGQYHEENKQPTRERLQQIIPILTIPNNPQQDPDYTCDNTTVTLKSVNFVSNCSDAQTTMDVLFEVEPEKNVKKILAYHCADYMIDQAHIVINDIKVKRLLRFRDDSNETSLPDYVVDETSCCEDKFSYEEPCCLAGYTLKDGTCLRNDNNNVTRVANKKGEDKGELMKMETEEKCEPTGPKLSLGVIIIIASGSLILFISILLAGVRIFKYKHRRNRSGYNDVSDVVITTEVQPEERRDTGESSIEDVVAPVEEETKDGYMKMQNLSKTNLFQNVREETTADAISHNASPTPTNDSESGQNSSRRSRVKSFRPLSHPEIMFTNFDKYIPKEAIEFTNKMLGRGQFGQVELAYATINGVRKKCAVKMIRGMGTHEDERELFEELQMLYQIPYHPNVVSLLGGCFDENSPLYVVVEYCAHGSLLKYLQNQRKDSHEYVNFSAAKMDFRWKLQRAMEICKGMIFLAQRQIIHRDLAARNILLDENEVSKISDFGMAKDVYLRGLYIKESAGFLPVRWMAIEAIGSRIYTIKSDMWSFGILLWELYMDGLNPYPGVADGNDLMEKYLKKGFRMAQPENCPDSFYNLMERCWLEKPEDRPSFTQALRDLENVKDEEMRRESEASKLTEVSDASDFSVFGDEPPQETAESTRARQNGTQEDVTTVETPHQENKTEVDVVENENPVEVGIVNRGRSSIDSGTDVVLPRTLRKNSDEQTSCF